MAEARVIAPWSWTPCKKPKWKPPRRELSNKVLTVVTWDEQTRDSRWIDLAYTCLSRQTALEQIDVIHVEWTEEYNKILGKYPFVDIYTMNQPYWPERHPFHDIGLQWSMGLYLARTPWVCFFHCDIIIPEQIEYILRKIEANPDKILLEGWEVNRKGKCRNKEHQKEFLQLLSKYGSDFDQLPIKYDGPARVPHGCNGVLCTFQKSLFIQEYNGFFWNDITRSDAWHGLGTPRYNGQRLRPLLTKAGKALVGQKDMAVFAIPHDRPIIGTKRERVAYHAKGPIKFYKSFVEDWLPQHPYTQKKTAYA